VEPSELISARVADVLAHTSRTGRYVTDEAAVITMASEGLLHNHGPQRLAGGMHYLTITSKGRDVLSAWRAAQPKPAPVKKRRRSRSFDSWRRYLGATYDRIPFPEYLKRIWPLQKDRA
jgi:hypothetical protein